jgi:hypothetical protein
MSTAANSYPVENIFGKMHGRYDEVMAKRAARSIADGVIAGLWSMSDEECYALVNRFNAEAGKCASQHLRLQWVGESP